MYSKKSGQSILEYVIVLAVIIVAVIVASTKIGDSIKGESGLMNKAAGSMKSAVGKVSNTIPN
ncbi:MAG: hypothetical protein AB1472_00530 [Candidatus Omnitrophota bacterium]